MMTEYDNNRLQSEEEECLIFSNDHDDESSEKVWDRLDLDDNTLKKDANGRDWTRLDAIGRGYRFLCWEKASKWSKRRGG